MVEEITTNDTNKQTYQAATILQRLPDTFLIVVF